MIPIIDVTDTWRDFKFEFCRLERTAFKNDAWGCSDLLNKLETADYIAVAWDDITETPVGYAAVELDPHDNVYGITEDIWSIAVEPAFQGRKLGKALLGSVLERFKGTPLRLMVRADNVVAIQMYVKHGFVEYDREPEAYVDGTDGLLMRCENGGHTS